MEWSDNNVLEMNTKKTEKFVYGKPSDSHKKKLSRYFHTNTAVMIDHLLSWKGHIEFVCKKTKQRIYFLRSLRTFGMSRQILLLFFT